MMELSKERDCSELAAQFSAPMVRVQEQLLPGVNYREVRLIVAGQQSRNKSRKVAKVARVAVSDMRGADALRKLPKLLKAQGGIRPI
jgi:hypothetical protein